MRRLISRDRKEFLGNAQNDILEKYKVELGDAVEVAPKDGPTISASELRGVGGVTLWVSVCAGLKHVHKVGCTSAGP